MQPSSISSLPGHRSRGYTFALLSSVFLSTTALFIRHLTQSYQLPALVLAFWRDVFVVITLGIALLALRPALLRIHRSHWFYLILYGFALSAFNATWTLSVHQNGASVATVLVYCSTAFTVLLGWWLLKEQLRINKVAAVVLCMAGCFLVAEAFDPAAWGTNFGGILTGIFSGLFYAIYTLMGRSASQRGLNPWTTLLYTFGFAALFLLIMNLQQQISLPGQARLPQDLFWLGSSWSGWAWLILLAAVPTVAGFGLYNVSLSYLPSSVVNLIVTLEPPFTALFAFLILGERMKGIHIIGGLVILSGVLILRIFDDTAPSRSRNLLGFIKIFSKP